jgi:hypothetical protein
LRSAELERLSWETIHFKEKLIEVPALSKTASRPFVSSRESELDDKMRSCAGAHCAARW